MPIAVARSPRVGDVVKIHSTLWLIVAIPQEPYYFSCIAVCQHEREHRIGFGSIRAYVRGTSADSVEPHLLSYRNGLLANYPDLIGAWVARDCEIFLASSYETFMFDKTLPGLITPPIKRWL